MLEWSVANAAITLHIARADCGYYALTSTYALEQQMTVFSSMSINTTKVVVVVMLCVVTMLCSQLVDRYQFSGEELLVNNNFENKLEGWQKLGSGDVEFNGNLPITQLESHRTDETTAIRQTLVRIEKGQPLHFTGSIKTEGVGRGEKVWEAARMIFVGVDDNGRSMYNTPHILTVRNGTTDWERFSKVFVSSSNAAKHYIEIQLVNVKGVAWVKELSLRPVAETFQFRLFWAVFLLGWCVVSVWVLAPYRRTMFASKLNIVMMVLAICVLFGVLAPNDLKNSSIESLKFLFPWIDEEEGFFRIGHFSIFTLLSAIACWRVKPGRAEVARFWLIILFAMVTEILQLFVDGRTPRVSDFLVDLSGMVLGFCVSRLFSPYKTDDKESYQRC